MPGRPKAWAMKAAELEELAIELVNETYRAAPQAYTMQIGEPISEDPLCRIWLATIGDMLRACISLWSLGDRLRAKAGITEPGPTELFWTPADSCNGDTQVTQDTDSLPTELETRKSHTGPVNAL